MRFDDARNITHPLFSGIAPESYGMAGQPPRVEGWRMRLNKAEVEVKRQLDAVSSHRSNQFSVRFFVSLVGSVPGWFVEAQLQIVHLTRAIHKASVSMRQGDVEFLI